MSSTLLAFQPEFIYLQKSTFYSLMLGVCCLASFLGWMIIRRERINRELKEQKKQLDDVLRVKNKLLSIIGNDMRAPLSSSYNLIQLLKTSEFEPEQQLQLLNNLSLSTASSIETLNNIYEWGKWQLNPVQAEPRKLNLNFLAQSNFDLLADIASQKDVSLINNIPTGLSINGDLNQVSFIIRNLLGNAIKFSFPGSRVEISAQEEDEELVQVCVKDYGVGITEESIKKILHSDDLFSTTGTANEKGSGLGLRLSKDFIEHYGGRLSIKNQPDRGSEFRFSLKKKAGLETVSAGY